MQSADCWHGTSFACCTMASSRLAQLRARRSRQSRHAGPAVSLSSDKLACPASLRLPSLAALLAPGSSHSA